jgi:hypothetical protein
MELVRCEVRMVLLVRSRQGSAVAKKIEVKVRQTSIWGPLLRAPLFALIMLTQPGGNVIWIETGHLAIIKDHCHTHGHDKPGSVIAIGGRELCVLETPDQIREKIKDADRH